MIQPSADIDSERTHTSAFVTPRQPTMHPTARVRKQELSLDRSIAPVHTARPAQPGSSPSPGINAKLVSKTIILTFHYLIVRLCLAPRDDKLAKAGNNSDLPSCT